MVSMPGMISILMVVRVFILGLRLSLLSIAGLIGVLSSSTWLSMLSGVTMGIAGFSGLLFRALVMASGGLLRVYSLATFLSGISFVKFIVKSLYGCDEDVLLEEEEKGCETI